MKRQRCRRQQSVGCASFQSHRAHHWETAMGDGAAEIKHDSDRVLGDATNLGWVAASKRKS